MITVEFRDGNARVSMGGETGQLSEEAPLIVNSLYVALKRMDHMAGAYFEYKTRLDDSVWDSPDASKIHAFQHIKMPLPDADAGE